MAKAVTFYAALRTQGAQRAARELNGRFRDYRWAVEAHQEAAYRIALMMREELDTRVTAREAERGFPARESRHLRRALVAPGNRRPMGGTSWLFGFAVGIPDFLDSTPAGPYWRNLEHGTSIFRGRPLLMTPVGPRDPIKRWGGQVFRSRFPVVFVERGIDAYQYMTKGAQRGVAWGQGGGLKGIYRDDPRAPRFR